MGKQLTQHFSEGELRVAGAEARVKENAKALAEACLEPIRQHYGLPIFVTSGYRPPAHNKAAGGKATSWHLYDEDKAAVDFYIPGVDVFILFEWLRGCGKVPFDRIILEEKNGVPVIIHLQYRKMNGRKRRAFIGNVGDSKSYTEVQCS